MTAETRKRQKHTRVQRDAVALVSEFRGRPCLSVFIRPLLRDVRRTSWQVAHHHATRSSRDVQSVVCVIALYHSSHTPTYITAATSTAWTSDQCPD